MKARVVEIFDRDDVVKGYERDEFVVRCGRFSLSLGKRTHIMGVINLTPDSFSGDGLYKIRDPRRTSLRGRQRSKKKIVDEAIRVAEQMVRDGADIIDVGGESTRPGAKPVAAREEMERVLPVLKELTRRDKIPISIDTSKCEVARRALDLGASIVNDISGLRADPALAKLVARYDVGVVIMHIKGRPRTMQRNPAYRSLISEIIASLRESIEIARRCGIDDEKIIVDPGIGFGKTTEHNLEILRRLSEFKSLGRPIMVGTSRKSLIGNVLGSPLDQRGWGTAATIALAIANGAHIVRVHDVKEMAQVARMTDAILKNQGLTP